MKLLPVEFRKNTYQYSQIFRDDSYAIYSQKDGGQLIAYEVFKINKNEEFELHGNIIPASESVPSVNQWGVRAWTVNSIERAYKKITQLKMTKEPNPKTERRNEAAIITGR